MSAQGNLYLKNESVIGLYDQVSSYEGTVQDALYSQYQSAFKISVTNYFRGTAADAWKNYMTQGAINIIAGLLDIVSDLTMIIQLFAEAFYQYECNHTGHVSESALDYIEETLKTKRDIFDQNIPELNAALNAASQYISTTSIRTNMVDTGYDSTGNQLKEIRSNLYSTDSEAAKTAGELFTRISEVKTLIQNIMSHCYKEDGSIDEDGLASLGTQSWYSTCGNTALYLLLEEDPFEYCAGEVTLSEDQWAAGLCSDVFAYAGYSFLNASYEAGVEDGTAFAKGKASVLSMNGYAQFTDYLTAEAEVKVLYAEGEAKAGFSDKYVGFKVKGEVGVIKADGTVMIGTEELNAYIKGEAKVLCADGKVAFEFEDDGEFAIGVDASATLASAGVKGGTTILGYKGKDSATGETETLLGFKVGAKANAGGSFAVWGESKTAYEGNVVNVNATTVKVDLSLLAGVDVAVTVPTIYVKWSW